MRFTNVFLALFLLVLFGYGWVWNGAAHQLRVVVDENLQNLSKEISERGSARLEHESLEIAGFPFLPKIDIVAPCWVEENAIEKRSICADVMTVSAQDFKATELLVLLPEKVKFTSPRETYSAGVSDSPKLWFRLPAAELEAPKTAKAFASFSRVTPKEKLLEMPENIAHQYAIQMPASLNLVVEKDGVIKQRHFEFASVALRGWKLMHYRVQRVLDVLFSVMAETHDHGVVPAKPLAQ